MKEFIEEVNEELQWERIVRFLKKYGNFLIGCLIAFFMGLSGWIYWEHSQTQKMLETAAQYEQALLLAEKGDKEKSLELLHILSSQTKKGYHFLAQLKMAALKPEQRSEIYKKLAVDPKLEKSFQELAVILEAFQEMDIVKPIELAERLRPIATSATTPWRSSAAELLGLLLVKAGNISKAIEVYQNLSEDEGATPGIRARSSAMIDFLRK